MLLSTIDFLKNMIQDELRQTKILRKLQNLDIGLFLRCPDA